MNYNLLESTEKLFAEALSTMRKKNADYARDATSMRNFELSANVAGISMSKGILVRLMDKMTRIGNLMDTDAKVKDESVFDTIQDAINYSAILLHALRIEAENKEPVEEKPYVPGMRRQED